MASIADDLHDTKQQKHGRTPISMPLIKIKKGKVMVSEDKGDSCARKGRGGYSAGYYGSLAPLPGGYSRACNTRADGRKTRAWHAPPKASDDRCTQLSPSEKHVEKQAGCATVCGDKTSPCVQ